MVASGVAAFGAHLSARVEERARKAYHLSGLDPADPPGTGVIARHLYGLTSLNLMDAVPAGQPFVEFAVLPGATEERPVRVNLRRGQRPELMTWACAIACARFVAWAHMERWTADFVRAVSLAIIMPSAAILPMLDLCGPDDIACEFLVDADLARERIHTVRGTHDSGERHAFVG